MGSCQTCPVRSCRSWPPSSGSSRAPTAFSRRRCWVRVGAAPVGRPAAAPPANGRRQRTSPRPARADVISKFVFWIGTPALLIATFGEKMTLTLLSQSSAAITWSAVHLGVCWVIAELVLPRLYRVELHFQAAFSACVIFNNRWVGGRWAHSRRSTVDGVRAAVWLSLRKRCCNSNLCLFTLFSPAAARSRCCSCPASWRARSSAPTRTRTPVPSC